MTVSGYRLCVAAQSVTFCSTLFRKLHQAQSLICAAGLALPQDGSLPRVRLVLDLHPGAAPAGRVQGIHATGPSSNSDKYDRQHRNAMQCNVSAPFE